MKQQRHRAVKQLVWGHQLEVTGPGNGSRKCGSSTLLFLPHYCSTIFSNRDTCKCGSVPRWCAIEQHCSQPCFPHPFMGVTTEGTFKAAIITKRTFMVLLLRALTNTSFMWICLPECLSGEAWPEKASKGGGPPRLRGQHEQSWQCLPACHVPVRCMHLAVVGKAAGEGGRATVTRALYAGSGVWLHPQIVHSFI